MEIGEIMSDAPDFIPDSEFKQDAPDFIPDGHPDAPVVAHGAPDFIPDAHFVSDEQTYGTGPQQALAGIEGVARGASLGLSDLAETRLAGVKPEEIAARQRSNPWTSGIGAAVGAGGTAALTGGGSLIAEGLGGGALAGAVGLGTEGAVFGAGNAVSDYALGDPDLNAQKVLSHIGWGLAGGSVLGAVAGKLGAFAPKAIGEALEGSSGSEAPLMGYDEPKNAGPIKSFDDLQERIAKAQASGLTYELPQKQVLVDSLSRLSDLENPALPQQIEALNSKGSLDAYRIAFREGDSDVAKGVQNYEAIQKAELVKKTDQAIESLSPEIKPTSNDVQGGIRATEAFAEQYQAEKKTLVPMFKMLERVDLGPIRADIVPLMEKLSEKIPAVARMFEYGEDGLIKEVSPFDEKWGLARSAYTSVKNVFKSLELGSEDPASFQDLLNLRGSMDEHVNVLSKDKGPSQIRGLKAGFMDYMQGLADDHIADVNLRDTFKRYAINEQDRSIIEKTFGAGVGENNLNYMPGKPVEDVLGKIFKDTSTVKAAKRILDPAKFDELLASHMAHVRETFTNNGVFSSNRFLKYLRQHSAELGEAFSHQSESLQRLNDLSTFSTIIPDMASINPSGSAKTFMGLIKNLSLGELGIGAFNPKFLAGVLGKRTWDMLMEAKNAREAVTQFNSGLVGRANKQASLAATQKILDSVNANLDRATKSIFKNEEPANAR